MKHPQEEPAANVARYESLSRASPVGIVLFDAAGKCVDVNRRWCEMTGLQRADALGDGWYAASHPEDRERVVQQWTAMLQEGQSIPCEHRLHPDTGRILWVVCQADRITNSRGETTGYVRTLTDVTRQKQTEQALRLVSTDLTVLRGAAFFEAVALRLAELLECTITSVCRRDDAQPGRLVTLAWCEDGRLQPNLSYAVAGTPCGEDVDRGNCIVVPRNVQQQYPDDEFLVAKGVEAYVGLRLTGSTGQHLGHLAVMSCKPFHELSDVEAILKIFSLSVVAEIERQQSEEALQDAKIFADTIIESVSGLFYVLDRDGMFVRWNQSGQELFGLSDEQMRHTNALAVVHEDDRERIAGEIAEVFTNGHAHAEARLLLKEGVRHFLLNGRKLEIHGMVYLVGSGADIGERMQAEEEIRLLNHTLAQRVAERTAELTAANAELHKASQAKSEFLTTMSHELRTPLNGILGMNELLLASELTERQRQYVDASSSSGKLLMQLINDILDLSKIEAGKLELDPRECDLEAVVSDVIASMSYAAQQKNLSLTCQIAPDACVTAMCDDSRLRQVLVNLVGNAIKFTSSGEVILRAEQAAGGEDGLRLRFSVSDTGIGIPAERHHRLFAAFSQVDSSTTRRYGGTGLGLSICRKLVDLMGGRIGVESQVGVGSTFWFEIPLPSSVTLRIESKCGRC